MFTIRILKSDKGKIYTNGKIKGRIVWVSNDNDVSNWYQIDDADNTNDNKTNSNFLNLNKYSTK